MPDIRGRKAAAHFTVNSPAMFQFVASVTMYPSVPLARRLLKTFQYFFRPNVRFSLRKITVKRKMSSKLSKRGRKVFLRGGEARGCDGQTNLSPPANFFLYLKLIIYLQLHEILRFPRAGTSNTDFNMNSRKLHIA